MSRDTSPKLNRGLWWLLALAVVAVICGALMTRKRSERADNHRGGAPAGLPLTAGEPIRTPAVHPKVAGVVRDADGCSISGAIVVLVAADNGVAAAILATTKSDSGGAFELDPGGHQLVTVVAAADRFTPAWRDVEIAAGQDRLQLTLILQRGGFTVSGRVLDAAGGIVGGALVFRRPGGFEGDERVMAASVGTDDGRYRITLAKGDHVLVFHRDGYADKTLEVRADRDQEIDVHLSPGARISGTVVQGPSDAPVDGAVVSLRALRTNEQVRQAKADARGRFVLSGLPAAVYELNAEGAGVVGSLDRPLLLRPLSTEEVLIRLRDGGTVSGRVTGAAGVPIAGAKVGVARVEHITSRAEMVGTTGPDGRYSVRGVLPEHSSIVVHGPGLSWASRSISVRPGEVVTGVDFTLPAAVDIDVRVVAAGVPVPGAQISAIVGDRHGKQMTTRDDGVAQLPGIPEGKVLLTAMHENKGEGRATVVVGSRRTFEIALENSATIRVGGQVAWDRGVAAADVPVYIFCFGLGFARTRTDAMGRYEFRGCEPGVLSVEASHREQSLDVWRRAQGNSQRDELRSGEEARIVDLRVREGGGVLSGQVVTPDGSPVMDATVMARASLERRTTLTDGSGHFEITDLARGEYEVNVIALGFPKVWMKTKVNPRRDLRIELQQGATLRGRVLEPDGKPRAFGRVLAASSTGYNDETHTALGGTFVLAGLLPGDYRILVRDPQRGDVAVSSVRLGPGEDKSLEVIAPGSTVGERKRP